MKTKAIGAMLACCALGLGTTACGDVESTDRRGYTKAPLEEAGLTVTPEPRTVMDELGEPVLPRPGFTPPTPPGDEDSGG